MSPVYVGQRLSLRGQRCTARYVGPVDSKPGTWLGVEWDDPIRGRHEGSVGGRAYFQCRSRSPTCASFIKPDVRFDPTQSVHEALRTKYASEDDIEINSVRVSGKMIEETGYDKITKRQQRLHELTKVILDKQDISASQKDHNDAICSIAPDCTDLDVSWNLLESTADVKHIIEGALKLRSLSLEGNRFRAFESQGRFTGVTSLNVDDMLLKAQELEEIMKAFPSVKNLSAGSNLMSDSGLCNFNDALVSVTLDSNHFSNLEDVSHNLKNCKELSSLSLKHNAIHLISKQGSSPSRAPTFPTSLRQTDLTWNEISDWSFISALSKSMPDLSDLRISHNPIYHHSKHFDGKPLSEAEVSMLIVARLRTLKSLNYTTVLDKDRLNAETFYLSIIAEEISADTTLDENEILRRHPRFNELCEEYGRPVIARQATVEHHPNSIAARLVKLELHLTTNSADTESSLDKISDTIVTEMPSSFSMYNVYSHVARLLHRSPSNLRLIWETGEKDPPGQGINVQHTIEEWDSEDEDTQRDWIDREEELVPGTKALGIAVQGKQASMRVELHNDTGMGGPS